MNRDEQILTDYMRQHYGDADLVVTLGHVENRKLSFWSCCCFIAIPTADHELRGEMGCFSSVRAPHYQQARMLEGAEAAEQAFCDLGFGHGGEQEEEAALILTRLILAEMARREEARSFSQNYESVEVLV